MLVFLTLVGAALLGLVVVVIYLNDRVNELERRTAAAVAGGVSGGGEDNSWHGLTGKRLWDAMTGKKGITALDDAGLQALRQTYEDVLSKHIESLFRAGQADARKGGTVQPTAVKTLATARGAVQSWIPLNHANALYRAGVDSTKTDIYEVERARMTLDDTAQLLFSQTGLSLNQPFSDLLLGNGGSLTGQDPTVDSSAQATDAAAGSNTWAEAPAATSMTAMPGAAASGSSLGAAPIPPAGGMFTASTGPQDSSSR
jgi:hypothetical protein